MREEDVHVIRKVNLLPYKDPKRKPVMQGNKRNDDFCTSFIGQNYILTLNI